MKIITKHKCEKEGVMDTALFCVVKFAGSQGVLNKFFLVIFQNQRIIYTKNPNYSILTEIKVRFEAIYYFLIVQLICTYKN